MVPVADNCFFFFWYRILGGISLEWNWTELSLNDSKGVAAPFGAKSKS